MKNNLQKRTLTKTYFVAFLLMGVGFVLLSGCDSSDSFSQMPDDEAAHSQEENLKYAINMLQNINESDGTRRREQIVDRLNQWIPSQKLPSNWKPDPMLKTLPEGLQPQGLDSVHFSAQDGCELRQAIWMRDLSKWVCDDAHDTIECGERLFDWIVRNIQLQKMPTEKTTNRKTPTEKTANKKEIYIPKYPWEALLFGRGTAVDRAWVFALAARQQAMDAVILSVPSKEDPSKLVPWAVGLLEGDELYLFEPKLGLPIPAKGGISFEEKEGKGQLAVQPATLSQVLKNPKILEILDVSETKKYPITADQVKQVVAMIPTSAASLSARFALVDSKMVGDQRVILTAHPSAFAEELQKVKGLSADRIRLWHRPFEVDKKRAKLSTKEEAILASAMQPFTIGRESPLWKGRAAHIMGKLTGRQGATYYYYDKVNLPESELVNYEGQLTSDPSLSQGKIARTMKAYYQAKEDARYWLGLLNYSLDNLKSSKGYLNQTIASPLYHQFTIPVSLKQQWLPGAYYNLGRCNEREGEISKSLDNYRDPKIKNKPDAYGNELRASWLQLYSKQPAVLP